MDIFSLALGFLLGSAATAWVFSSWSIRKDRASAQRILSNFQK